MRVLPHRSPLSPGWLIGLLLVSAPIAVIAHTGHGHGAEFQSGSSQPVGGIRVDPTTAKRLGIQTAPVKLQFLSIGIQTTGDLVAQPDQTVTVTAPISGKVAERPITLGEAVEEAVTPMLSIVNGDGLRVTANVYEKDLGKVAPGQTVRVSVASLPDQFFQGQVVTVGAVVDGTTRIVPVTRRPGQLRCSAEAGHVRRARDFNRPHSHFTMICQAN